LIVIADDNADMRDHLSRLLRSEYRVHAVSNGVSAVEAARNLRPSLVLTDVMMPELNGFGVLREIRTDPTLSSTPVILLSARAGEESRVEGLDAGADDYLVKPFTARELLARVAAHVKMANLRREAMQREARLLQRLAAIVESSDDAIISKDLNGMVTSWNSGAQRMFGYTAEEIIGRPVMAIIPQELQGDEAMILNKIRSGENIDHFETVRLSKSGERIDVSLSISPMKDERGHVIGAAKIARDITQNKKIEQSLRTTEKLAAAGRMAATVAHEINNPLEAVTNLIYLAKHDLPNATKVGRYLELALHELGRVAHIARQTLGFYRDSSSPTTFSVTTLLDDLLSFYQKRFKGRKIKVVRQYGDDIEISALAGEIRQAFSNLISNAIDAMPLGGSLIARVSPCRDWKDLKKAGVRITIVDTGSGIARQHRNSIFQPFFTTKTDVGTGLGLWITQNIIKKHHGAIHVKSRTGLRKHGTAFSIFLPSNVEGESLRERGSLAETCAVVA
jgi:PAS domain S-box-containing protein